MTEALIPVAPYSSFSCVGENRSRYIFPPPELFPSETVARGPENGIFFPRLGAWPCDPGENNGFWPRRTGAMPWTGVAENTDFRPGPVPIRPPSREVILDPVAPNPSASAPGLRPAAVSGGSRGPPGTWDDRRVDVAFFPSEPAVSPKEHGPDLGNSAEMSVDTTIKLFNFNPRGLRENQAQVDALVESIGHPQVVGRSCVES